MKLWDEKINLISGENASLVLISSGVNFVNFSGHGFNSEDYSAAKNNNLAYYIDGVNVFEKGTYHHLNNRTYIFYYYKGLAVKIKIFCICKNVQALIYITNLKNEKIEIKTLAKKDVTCAFLQKNASLYAKTIKIGDFAFYYDAPSVSFESNENEIAIRSNLIIGKRKVEVFSVGIGEKKITAREALSYKIMPNDINKKLRDIAISSYYYVKENSFLKPQKVKHTLSKNNFLFINGLSENERSFLKKFNLPLNFYDSSHDDFVLNNKLKYFNGEITDALKEYGLYADSVEIKNNTKFHATCCKTKGNKVTIVLNVKSKNYKINKHLSYVEIADNYFFRKYFIFFEGKLTNLKKLGEKVQIEISSLNNENFIVYSQSFLSKQNLLELFIDFNKSSLTKHLICDLGFIRNDMAKHIHSLNCFDINSLILLNFKPEIFISFIRNRAFFNQNEQETLLFSLCMQDDLKHLLQNKMIAIFIDLLLRENNYTNPLLMKNCFKILSEFCTDDEYRRLIFAKIMQLRQKASTSLDLFISAVESENLQDVYFYYNRLEISEKTLAHFYMIKIVHKINIKNGKINFSFNPSLLVNGQQITFYLENGNHKTIQIAEKNGYIEIINGGRSYFNINSLSA